MFRSIKEKLFGKKNKENNKKPDLKAKPQEVKGAAATTRLIERKIERNKLPAYPNSETFISLTPVSEIPKQRLLVLDKYAFDVNELKQYAESDLDKLYQNPHITERNANNQLSATAKNILRQHSVLGVFAKELDANLRKQKLATVRPETIDAVIVLLNKYKETGESGSLEANAEFLNYKNALPKEEQDTLDKFRIEIPTKAGGLTVVHFNDAFEEDQCVIFAQIMLWQFVVSLRNSAMNDVPESVQKFASARGMIISNDPNLLNKDPDEDLDEEFLLFQTPQGLMAVNRNELLEMLLIQMQVQLAGSREPRNAHSPQLSTIREEKAEELPRRRNAVIVVAEEKVDTKPPALRM